LNYELQRISLVSVTTPIFRSLFYPEENIAVAENLKGQIALVTGANRGIGRQISCDLAAAGATVVLSARVESSLKVVAEEIEKAGGNCECVSLDVMREDLVGSVVNDIVSRHGRIDLLVNNAGIGAGSKYPWDLPVDD